MKKKLSFVSNLLWFLQDNRNGADPDSLYTSADSHPPLVSFLTPIDILHATHISYLVFIYLLTISPYFNLLLEINSSKVISLKWKKTKTRKKKTQKTKHSSLSASSEFISNETTALTSVDKMSFVLPKLFYIKGFWWVLLLL